MKKLMGLFLLSFGFLLMSNRVEAAGAARGAKATTSIIYSTVVTTITANSATLYSVLCSSPAAAGDYMLLFDTAPVVATTVAITTRAAPLKDIVMLSSTAYNYGLKNYDPPILFTRGIIAVLSSASNVCTLVWEPGRNMMGN